MKEAAEKIPIFHMASMARSGETMVLRDMSVHPNITVASEVFDRDHSLASELRERFKKHESDTFSLTRNEKALIGYKPGSILLVKQGVWEHKHPFKGFVLARNPASVYASLIDYDSIKFDKQYFRSLIRRVRYKAGHTSTNKARLTRWMKDIDPDLCDTYQNHNQDLDTIFCSFYNRRMGALADLGLPIIHYEEYVTNPAKFYSIICQHLGLEESEALGNAHQHFSGNSKGHGRTDLTAPVNDSSLLKYKQLGRRRFDKVVALTHETTSKLNYTMTWENISIKPV